MFFNAITSNPYFILGVILVVFAAIAIFVYLLRKVIPGFKEKEEPVSEEQAIEEELERVLVTIEDEETKKQMEKLDAPDKDTTTKDGK